MEKIKKTIKNATCWDWAYICVSSKGACSRCKCCVNKKCAFALYQLTKQEGELEFETNPVFEDNQKDILEECFNEIIRRKEIKCKQ